MIYIYIQETQKRYPVQRPVNVRFAYVQNEKTAKPKTKVEAGEFFPSEEFILTNSAFSLEQQEILMNIYHNKTIVEAKQEYYVKPLKSNKPCNCQDCRNERIVNQLLDAIEGYWV